MPPTRAFLSPEPRCALHPLLATPHPHSCPDVLMEVSLGRNAGLSFDILTGQLLWPQPPGWKYFGFPMLYTFVVECLVSTSCSAGGGSGCEFGCEGVRRALHVPRLEKQPRILSGGRGKGHCVACWSDGTGIQCRDILITSLVHLICLLKAPRQQLENEESSSLAPVCC